MRHPQKLLALVVSVSCLAAIDAASAQDKKHYFFEADLVRHALEGQAGPFCVLANQFKRKEAVAWRIRVLEPDRRRRPTTRCSRAWSWNYPTARKSRRSTAPIRRAARPTDYLLVAALGNPGRLPDRVAGLQGHRHR